jgi:hypothetical protein
MKVLIAIESWGVVKGLLSGIVLIIVTKKHFIGKPMRWRLPNKMIFETDITANAYVLAARRSR